MTDRTFDAALRTAIPFMATTRHDALTSVRISGDTIWATDRYTAIRTRYTPAGNTADLDVIVTADHARTLAKIKGTPQITADAHTATFAYPDGRIFTFERPVVSYPEISALAAFWGDDSEYDGQHGNGNLGGSGVAVRPAHLARLAKIVLTDPQAPAVVRTRLRHQAVRFDFEDHTSALIVPVLVRGGLPDLVPAPNLPAPIAAPVVDQAA